MMSTLPIELDDLDRRILKLLQNDASLSNVELALRVHASAPTCLRRVKRLRDSGVIARQLALLAPEKLAPSLTVIVEISLDRQSAEDLAAFEALLAPEDAVLQCYRVSPGPDFVVLLCTTDMGDYHAFAQRVFAAARNVRNVRAFFATHCSKFEINRPLQ
ncbi:Lrp/AsnC family transcriptional regulator [Paludibacterium yongneupense]|uniref:Lrp/AsnC family transcriptional regulator n=1 Tax=Paludibacterium yongneupense TaxID=400061 RepID=UPI000410EAE7|nr:Lrp/AsnC family transcriptional regulator [Paludibacterium yongneupense]